ncbi:serine hydrolase domain-containing protein [Flagellimonas nanhaiensis]|uniref:Class A beta-lactamase-related serine hydrolase n=1 Tax=Flagellimonas nanhaiensis TaxID=2292706 RepID=A0A371JQA7_9FLAO|nr:serine hydrolase domain-containing protein [Allomuricauda nanhaiensis]RDY59702.1 class A beta-lactamase-related serine hydrolase [Allomuricauda nanhaiensis]
MGKLAFVLFRLISPLRLRSQILILLLGACFQFGHAQLSTSQYQKIDSVFVSWNTPNHPGGAIGVMKDGEVVFSKAYGLASLEYLMPNTTQMRFNVASVSKQLTAMGIIRLHLSGKLSIDDSLRKYVPELSKFADEVTIRHMLHHTSGLRSLHALFALAGWRQDDSRTNEDLYRIMKDQRDLNFVPGDEYLYCNTSYMYMAKIIEEVTGEEFSAWMKTSVFEPLGMTNTYVEGSYDNVVPNNATSYHKEKDGFKRAIEFWGYVGSGNVHSSTEDLLKWLENFSSPTPSWEKAFEMLQTLDPLNDGSYSNYAFGVQVDSLKGIKRIKHGGSIGGYRSFVCAFPSEKLNIAIITNFSTSSPSEKADKIAKLLLEGAARNQTEAGSAKKRPRKLSNKVLNGYVGDYWDDKNNIHRKIYLEKDTLRYVRSENNKSVLIPLSKDEFLLDESSRVRFKKAENGGKIMVLNTDSHLTTSFEAFEPEVYSDELLLSYAGEYYSPEIRTSYYISTEGNKITGNHLRHGDFEMDMIKKDVLRGKSTFNIVKIQRNEKGVITGALVSNGRVKNLWFEKRN